MSDPFTFGSKELQKWLVVETAKLRKQFEREYQLKAQELIDAGWKFEVNNEYHADQIMGWYWRRPPRRKGSKGMRFMSTDQALNHLRRNP